MMITTQAYPRAGLIGNPSDGYFGRTIAFTFRNFSAQVTLYESPALEILPNARDHSVFRSLDALAEDVAQYGYYGGIRLLKAAARKFHQHCRQEKIRLHRRNFTMRYESTIPHQVGLAGSSAIITACFRALTTFYGVVIPQEILPNLILSVEMDELSIAAGLQDRVAQTYQGLVYMDFDRETMERQGFGRYVPLDTAALPPLYIAYRTTLAEGSEIVHSDLRSRYRQGDKDVLDAIRFWADLTDRVRDLLVAGRGGEIGPLLDANFDRRRQVCRISEGNLSMVEMARSVGASAKFTGSGGAIVGTVADDAMFAELKRRFATMKVKVIRPELVAPTQE
jgi:glucuronokinase